MIALDLFCGLGGWSDGLAAEGFRVVGVELVDFVAKEYKHDVILANCCNLPIRDGVPWDLVVGSPPCRDFTNWAWLQELRTKGKWKRSRDIEGGLRLVYAFLDYVKKAKPRYWLMENVPGLVEYLDIKPKQKTPLTKGKWRCFWGNYPAFLVPRDYGHILHVEAKGPLKSWLRAVIPLPVAQALGRAVHDMLVP